MRKSKTIKLCICILLCYTMKTNAQNWLLTGNPAGVSDFIGTTNSNPFRIFTSNSEVARFLSSGELGLGTTTPASWLHVAPSGSSESFRTVSSSITTADAWRMFRGTQEIGRLWFGSSANAFNINGTRGPLHFLTGSTTGTTTNCAEFIGGTGSDKGWLGLGDWSNFTAKTNLHIHTSSAGNAGIQLTNTTTGSSATDGFRIINDNVGAVSLYNWEDKEIYFGTGNSGGGGSLGNRMVIMGGSNFGRVGIGTNSPGAKLHIYDRTDGPFGVDDIGIILEQIVDTSHSTAIGARIDVSGGTGTSGMVIAVDNQSSNTNVTMHGIFNRCRNTGPSNVQYAFNYYAQNESACSATNKYGFFAEMSGSNSTNSYGGYFSSTITGANNYGLNAIASGGSNLNYAIRATTPVGTCVSGGPCTSAAGYFDGDVFVTSGSYISSDAMFKTNIQPVNNASQILSALNVKTFDFNQSQFGNVNLPKGNHYGLIAQEVEGVLPNLVKSIKAPELIDSINGLVYPEFSYKAVNYTEFIPLLIKAYQEQQHVIDSLINSINVQIPIINPQNKQQVTLSNVQGIILQQNDPNPFIESTRIAYQLPDDVHDAKIIFTNLAGVVINTVIINNRQAGELEVYASDLSKGIYNYTLICDGKVISTKKMVKQ